MHDHVHPTSVGEDTGHLSSFAKVNLGLGSRMDHVTSDGYFVFHFKVK